MKILIVVDMQKDFVDGSLGTSEAVAIVPAVVERVKKAHAEGETVIFTRDTHEDNYLETQEGRNLPVMHCIEGTPGHEIIDELKPLAEGCTVIDKPTFGSTFLGEMLDGMNMAEPIEEITLIGLCTDICVISNAMIAKAHLTEVPVSVEAACCAGVTPASHNNALEAMKMCQIKVKQEQYD